MHSGYLKFSFLNACMKYGNYISDVIDREATKVQTEAHLQNSLNSRLRHSTKTETTQTFLMIFWEAYSANLKPFCES